MYVCTHLYVKLLHMNICLHTVLEVKSITLLPSPSSLTHPPLERVPLLQSHCVCLGNNWDYVDTVVQPLHELNVQGLQTRGRGSKRGRRRGRGGGVEREGGKGRTGGGEGEEEDRGRGGGGQGEGGRRRRTGGGEGEERGRRRRRRRRESRK